MRVTKTMSDQSVDTIDRDTIMISSYILMNPVEILINIRNRKKRTENLLR